MGLEGNTFFYFFFIFRIVITKECYNQTNIFNNIANKWKRARNDK